MTPLILREPLNPRLSLTRLHHLPTSLNTHLDGLFVRPPESSLTVVSTRYDKVASASSASIALHSLAAQRVSTRSRFRLRINHFSLGINHFSASPEHGHAPTPVHEGFHKLPVRSTTAVILASQDEFFYLAINHKRVQKVQPETSCVSQATVTPHHD
jgi:hypothetical protein